MKKGKYKFIVGFLILSTPMALIAQEELNPEEIKGTFTIYINSVKESQKNLSDDQLLEIESLRKDSEDIETTLGDDRVLIMSREKVEADIKWPKYSLLEK